MRVFHWAVISAVGALMVGAGAAVVLGSEGWASFVAQDPAIKDTLATPLIQESQVRQPPAAVPAPPQSSAKPAAPTTPRRVETIVYDSWVVTCQDALSGATKKMCVSSLRVMSPGGNRSQMLLNWQIGLNKDGHFVTAFRIPPGIATKKDNQMVGGGILIQNGLELKFGNGAPRRVNFVSCGPQQCFAEAQIDDAFVKEALANAKATITVYTVAGGAIPLELSIKGIDKAISATRR